MVIPQHFISSTSVFGGAFGDDDKIPVELNVLSKQNKFNESAGSSFLKAIAIAAYQVVFELVLK